MTTTALGDLDHYLIAEGTHARLYDRLGAHAGPDGTRFAVWAPHARGVSVAGDFNGWDPAANPLHRTGWSGVWEGVVEGAGPGSKYKYAITPSQNGGPLWKADPLAFCSEGPPGDASVVWDLSGYEWGDADWLAHRAARNGIDAPMAIYEVHLGSWMRHPDGRLLNYREVAPKLAEYASQMGFTHVELMPVAEAPFYGSWGYQVVGYFAASARYGTPQDLMYLIDHLHRAGLGVILDWVPAHFPTDPHGLAHFDGSPLYEPADPRRGINVEWDTHNFNYESPQVVNFLISNALFWLDKYHVDGLRVDAVEAMIRLDFKKSPAEWVPNRFGGVENLDAMAFMRSLNDRVHAEFPGAITIAEDASATPNITRPTGQAGLGFDLKWDLGWVHDTINEYLRVDPIHRAGRHDRLLFRMHYAFNERYVLPLSHDEVKKSQGSLYSKMPGDAWQKLATVRLLYGYMYAIPGKKMLFMGDELAQPDEWDHEASLPWGLLDDPRHAGVRRWVRDLNTTYRALPALHTRDADPAGFEWVDTSDREQSVISFLRADSEGRDLVLVVCNFTPVTRQNYRIGVPRGGAWEEILNSDADLYGGSGAGNMGRIEATPIGWHGRPRSLNLVLPPLGMIALKSTRA